MLLIHRDKNESDAAAAEAERLARSARAGA